MKKKKMIMSGSVDERKRGQLKNGKKAISSH